jgi:hypothetical protein
VGFLAFILTANIWTYVIKPTHTYLYCVWYIFYTCAYVGFIHKFKYCCNARIRSILSPNNKHLSLITLLFHWSSTTALKHFSHRRTSFPVFLSVCFCILCYQPSWHSYCHFSVNPTKSVSGKILFGRWLIDNCSATNFVIRHNQCLFSSIINFWHPNFFNFFSTPCM